MFQHTAARRRLACGVSFIFSFLWFQHTAARRRLAKLIARDQIGKLFQHTAARRRLAMPQPTTPTAPVVSTHSRPKAAGTPKAATSTLKSFQHTAARRRLDFADTMQIWAGRGFNTQPPEGGWSYLARRHFASLVSTHSRPKAAGAAKASPKAGRGVSTHSRPKAAGQYVALAPRRFGFQHTAARRRLADAPIAVVL